MIPTAQSLKQNELRETLLRSQEFLNWKLVKPRTQPVQGQGHLFIYQGKDFKNLVSTDPHLTPEILAEAWGLSAQTIRKVFKDAPGVLRIGKGKNGRRKYVSLRILEPVAERVHRRLSAIPQ
ncbi:MAG: hypothetical protein JWN63_2172 [Candidatus Acidoferrum typicum]|jgi:hypothetical protein|nr:hypothetical protein [Candidatus Acidoferrum typicum]